MSNYKLYNDNCLNILPTFEDNSIDMIFADPPYNLSNGGSSCHSGKRVSVNKGAWDKSSGFEEDQLFNEQWISECKRILKPEGTIWITGTNHNIFLCGYILQKMNFHILNDISWYKPNAAPNLCCNVFAHSHETLIWAKKEKNAKHTYNYEKMKNGIFEEDKLKNTGKQMRSVWSIPTPPQSEKKFGKHPTQKPIQLLKRIIQASTKEGDVILDPFCGSSTTGVATLILGDRKYIGIDDCQEFIELSKKRLESLSKEYELYE